MYLRGCVKLLAVCALIFGAAQAHGEIRRLDVEIEPIIILNCMPRVDYTVDTARLMSSHNASSSSSTSKQSSQNSLRQIEARFTADDQLAGTDGRTVEINIPDACSVRGLGRGEGFLVDVSPVRGAMLKNLDGGGSLDVRSAKARPSYGSKFTRRFSIPQQRIRLDSEIGIDVQLKIDLNNAATNGRYSSPVDGVFSIEVSAP